MAILLLFPAWLNAGNSHFFFQRIGLDDGLPNGTVMDIAQDGNNLIWFATFDGLNRFDGYGAKTFRHEEGNPNSLVSNLTLALFIDEANTLWVGTDNGLAKYEESMNRFLNFTPFLNDNKLTVNAIAGYKENELLLGTDRGLFVFDRESETFDLSQFGFSRNLEVFSIRQVGETWLVGTSTGLYYTRDKDTLRPFSEKTNDVKIQAITQRTDNEVWVGTEGRGLFLVEVNSRQEIHHYQHNPNDAGSICSNYIRTLLIDDEERLWIGTFHGLSLLDEGKEVFYSYYTDPFDETSLSQNSIRSILQDRQGGVWLGTYYGGANYYHPLKNQFYHLKQTAGANSLNDRIVSGIIEDANGKLWIGTNDGGINIFDPESNQFTYITKERNGALLSNNIKSLLQSKDNRHVFIGTHGGGLVRVNNGTGETVNMKFPANDVYSLSYDNDGIIWVGALTGLFKYNERNNHAEQIDTGTLTSTQVLYVKADSKGRLWIGGNKSLAYLSLETGKLMEFSDTFQQIRVHCIVEDSKREIWVGTNYGLYKYLGEERFVKYSELDGLSNNSVFGILEDSYGNLWLSTGNGINRFNPVDSKFRTYLIPDGLQFQQFNNYSFCKTSSGRIYFGGIEGIITFVPEQLKNNPYSLRPVITELSVQNRTVTPLDGTILEENIINAEKITLKSNQATFTLRLAVANYLSGTHNTFKYMLEGYDTDWIITSENHFASYSNIPHGRYTFKLQSANNEDYWSNETTRLAVIVTPLWFQTAWFKLLLAAAIMLAIFTLWQFFRQRQAIEKQLIQERFAKEKNEEINRAKMNFFVNISHEFRTPLTLIISPLQEMMEKVSNPWEKEQLEVIKNNADKLLTLTNQLIDYRRAELGVFELAVKKVNPKIVIGKTMALFDKLAKRMNVEYTFEDYASEEEYIIDENYLDIILSNLLSNAFKFTPPNGKITVSLIEDPEYLVLEVNDTGCGIPGEEQSLIFNRFHKVNGDQNDIGMGIGLSITQRLAELHHGKVEVKSKVGEGSTFSVYFPQSENLYSEKELKDIVSLPVKELLEEVEWRNMSLDASYSHPKILIVEDNEELLTYMANNLSELYHIVTARNGKEALEMVNQNGDIEIIVSDIMMEAMDGIELCKSVKENIKTCHIPVILLSAKSTIEDQLSGLGVGADDYVTKPFTTSVLKAKINNMIASRERMLNYYSNATEVEPEKLTTNQIDNELLNKAKDIVLDNLDNTAFTTEMLCEEMGMSRTNLHLKLKAITGKSAIDFIRKIRFSEAIKLLSSGRYNVSEVSYMVGFNSLSYFSTSFKKYFGYLPSDYMKRVQGKQP
jgi:signal transduction histidine kinase/ligand-binding sensor domain-containing protein/DNA-binding response OmpR family regulator